MLHVKNPSCFIYEEIYKNNIAYKSQIKYLKYILGVNKHASNLVVLLELVVSPCTVELQWLEHLWNPENMFETGVVRANECLS